MKNSLTEIRNIFKVDAKIFVEAQQRYNYIKTHINGRIVESSYAHLLYVIKSMMGGNCKIYCEIGILFGGSLALVMQEPTKTFFIGIDPFGRYYDRAVDDLTRTVPTLQTAEKNIQQFNQHNHPYKLCVGTSQESLSLVRGLNINFDCLFIDGSHTEEGVIFDWEKYSPLVNKNGIIIMDDYYYHPFQDSNRPPMEKKGVTLAVHDHILPKYYQEYKILYQNPNPKERGLLVFEKK